jgi:uncharacterized iron-regulated membrane protein
MINRRLLLDVAPDPVHVVGWGALILIAILGFVFVFSLIIGFVILLKRRRRGSSPTVREGVLPASVNESLR